MVRSLELPDRNVEKLLYLSSGKNCPILRDLTKIEKKIFYIVKFGNVYIKIFEILFLVTQ